MNVTVFEAMKIEGLANCRVAAGHSGLYREIKYVTVMEVPDVIHWLKGDDFILTSLYAIKDDTDAQKQLVKQLVDKGSAALAIKTHRYFEGIPECILESANRYAFPIIEISPEIAYLDILTPLTRRILDKNRINIEDFFAWLTETSMEGHEMLSIIDMVEKFLDNMVTLESRVNLPHPVPWEGKIAPLTVSQRNALIESKHSLRMTRVFNKQHMDCIVTPIILNGELEGCLTCWQTTHNFQQLDLTVLERVAPFLALELLGTKTRIEVEQKYKNDFMSGVLFGNIRSMEEITEKARLYGWNFSLNYATAVFDMDHFSKLIDDQLRNEVSIQSFKQHGLRALEKLIETELGDSITVLWSDKFIVLFPFHRTENKERSFTKFVSAIQKVQFELHASFPDATFTIGVSRPHFGIDGLREGYIEADASIRLGRPVFGRDTVICFDDLGVYRLLSELSNSSELKTFYMETSGKLEEYDSTHGTELLESLRLYFLYNFNVQDAARAMYIHPNTLKYRLRRVEEITEFSLNDAEGRLHLHLGLKIWHMFRHK
ncbi:PucR family transcriptional regulator [Alicyclobacillus mengziensis]|uniref:PucR family transcriptional regulator ligand-binding domain-containing protein n=1 Tax=Alicyclobacillus mengziensis TaxID=2931921 RepID=A0A9X7W263_9BACL|nr:PucR family transcriptional regulator [Alicyclobacillus mengziensis]QSO49361.1 PucR family transcriptional regulator ligand-binding domain-containing protein [Alicyclobacillus mengziensis]